MARPPPASKLSASANSAITSARRKPCRPVLRDAPPPSFSTSFKFMRAARHAGAQPNNTPASITVTTVNSSTGTLMRTSVSESNVYGGIEATIAFINTHAKPIPSTPPTDASARLSIRNCVNICRREAPTEARTATSLCRAAPRASSRFATLAQAISSTKPTAPSSSGKPFFVSGFRKSFLSGSTLTPQPLFDFG